MSQTISNLGTQKVDATEQTNVTGQMTPILSLSPIDGMEMEVQNQGGAGVPIYLDLQDSAGNDLPLDTEVTIRYDAPHLDQPQVISETLANIQTYRSLSIKEQQNEEYRDRTRVRLKGSAVVVRDIDELEIAAESSAAIDWANSAAYVEGNAVVVRSED